MFKGLGFRGFANLLDIWKLRLLYMYTEFIYRVLLYKSKRKLMK